MIWSSIGAPHRPGGAWKANKEGVKTQKSRAVALECEQSTGKELEHIKGRLQGEKGDCRG